MFNNIKTGIQQAFFDSLEKAGCLSLETENPDSSDDGEDDDVDDDVEGSQDDSEEGTEDEEESEEEDGQSDRQGGYTGRSPGLIDTRVVGFGSFLRMNPKTDRFPVERIHHIEIWCPDATNTASRFSWALGMPVVAKSDLSTGNSVCTSYALKCGEVLLCFSAPQSSFSATAPPAVPRVPFPSFNPEQARSFITEHGLGVRALAVEVADVPTAYAVSLTNGAKGVSEPVQVDDPTTGSSCWLAEVSLVGDVVLRFVKPSVLSTPFLPNFSQASNSVMSYGLNRIDHVVGAVENLQETLQYIKSFTGFHEFDEEAGISSAGGQEYSVLVNNNESVLLPIISPGKQQEQSRVGNFLQNNIGPGIQHVAVMCNDIVQTVQEMRARSLLGGLQFHPRPPAKYYKDLKGRLGSKLSQQQLDKYQELGILVDMDDRGILLQIFTSPVSDRETLSLEIVQRLSYKGASFPSVGCGGFGVNHVASLQVEMQGR